jgi:hypothetical protein
MVEYRKTDAEPLLTTALLDESLAERPPLVIANATVRELSGTILPTASRTVAVNLAEEVPSAGILVVETVSVRDAGED